jgi:hypothetical protein
MIRHKLSLFVICAALATQGQVLCRWTADSSRSSQVAFDCYRGETLVFTPSLSSYGTSITNYTATLLWQTNGMGTAWWSTNVLAFTPSMDVGATRYTIFIRAAMTNGVNYRANGTITMRNAPGFTPNTLPLPVPSIDFATVTPTNAPWLLTELDPGIPAAIASAVAQAGTNATAIASVAQSNAVAFASTNPVYKVYAPGSATEWIDGAGNKYVVSNFWNMTFSADFSGGELPSQTNYLFTSAAQWYNEGWTPLPPFGGTWDWRISIGGIYYFPGGFYTRDWLPTTNSLVLDPVLVTGASGHAYVSYWTTTNLVGTFALESSLTAGLAGKVSTNDATYTQTVEKASTALQVQTQQVYVATAGTAGTVTGAQAGLIASALQSESDPTVAGAVSTHNSTNTAHAALFAGKVGTDRTITVNGATGTLASNLSFTVTAGITGATVTNIVNAFTFTNQTWAATGTNATYRMSWDVTNGTFRVEEILP